MTGNRVIIFDDNEQLLLAIDLLVKHDIIYVILNNIIMINEPDYINLYTSGMIQEEIS